MRGRASRSLPSREPPNESADESGRDLSLDDNPETFFGSVIWITCLCCRKDGTPIGTRLLDIVARLMFWATGLMGRRTSAFCRPFWNFLTRSQLTTSCPTGNNFGIRWNDIVFTGNPDIPVRFYSHVAREDRDFPEGDVCSKRKISRITLVGSISS